MHDSARDDRTPAQNGYESPRLTVLGSVFELTQFGSGHGKSLGGGDGFSFMGWPITNSS